MNHNFTCETGWELLNEKGEVVDSSFSKNDCLIEGSFKVSVLDKDCNEIRSSEETPMRSFVSGFLTEALGGYRLELGLGKENVTNTSTQKTDKSYVSVADILSNSNATVVDTIRTRQFASKRYTLFGSSNSPTYVQQIRPIKPPIVFSNSAFMDAPTAASTKSNFILDEIDSDTNDSYIEIKLHTEKTMSQSSGNFPIKEVCLYGTNGRMIARDVVSENGLTYQSGDNVRINWTIRFPRTKGYTLTKNWVQNFLQNLNYQSSDFNKFYRYDSDIPVNANSLPNTYSRSFTNFNNIIANTSDDTMGIVVGSSDNDVDYMDSNLGSLISNSDISYENMNTNNTWKNEYEVLTANEILPLIIPSQGKACVRFWRDFTNGGNNDVIINEAGVLAKTSVTTEGVSEIGSYLISHWKTGRIVIPSGYILRVYWIPTVYATPENNENVTSDIYVISDEDRTTLSGRYRNISMIIANVTDENNTDTYTRRKNWFEMNEYIDNLNAIKYGGYSDWRLPTVKESTTVTLSSRVAIPEDELFIFLTDYTDLQSKQPSGSTWDFNWLFSNYIYTFGDSESTTSAIFAFRRNSSGTLQSANIQKNIGSSYYSYMICRAVR